MRRYKVADPNVVDSAILDAEELDEMQQAIEYLNREDWEAVFKSTHFTGEMKLALAVLESGILAALGNPRTTGLGKYKVRRVENTDNYQAQEWIASDSEECFSFRMICSVLGLDPTCVRKRISEAKATPASGKRVGAADRAPIHRAHRRLYSAPQTAGG